MDFEWDETKRLSNIGKHGWDFVDANRLFEIIHILAPAKTVRDEIRQLVTGKMGEDYVTVIFAQQGDVLRIISMRKASRNERKQYRQVHGG